MSRFLATDDLRDELRDRLDAAPEAALEFQRRYDMSWFFHENALEGVVLTEEEILQALEYHVVADATLLPLVILLRNHRDALALARAEAARSEPLGPELLLRFFEILQKGLERKNEQVHRKEMPLHRAYYHEIVQPGRIAGEVEKLCLHTAAAEFRDQHPIRQAAHVHWHLMRAYPFVDHNGRVARLAQNVFLMRAGYPPAIIHAVDRQRYYDALRLPAGTLRALLAEALENSLANGVKWLGARRDAARRAASE